MKIIYLKLIVALLMNVGTLVAQKYSGGSFDGSASSQSGVISLIGSTTSFAYTNPRFFGGNFDGSSSLVSPVISLAGNPSNYTYTNPRFFGGSFDGSSMLESGISSLNGTVASYTYINPRFFGGQFDGYNSSSSDTITLSGVDTLFTYTNPKFYGGSFSGASIASADSVFTLDVEEKTPSVKLPKQFDLSQNYPNPFNPSTIIQFDIPKVSQVRLDLYDILGRKVATLINQRKNPGTYSFNLNAARFNLSSGIYFYRIEAGNYSHTRKMVLVK